MYTGEGDEAEGGVNLVYPFTSGENKKREQLSYMSSGTEWLTCNPWAAAIDPDAEFRKICRKLGT